MAAWKAQFCGLKITPVLEVDVGLLGATTSSSRSQSIRGGRQVSVATTYPTTWTTTDAGRTDANAEPPAQDAMVPDN